MEGIKIGLFFIPWNLTICLTFCTPFIMHVKSQLDISKISYSLYYSFAQKMLKFLNLAFKAFHISVSGYNFVSCVFIYFLLQSYLIFTLRKASSLSQPHTFVQPHYLCSECLSLGSVQILPATQFLKAHGKSPLFSQGISQAYHCAVISSFSGLLQLLLFMLGFLLLFLFFFGSVCLILLLTFNMYMKSFPFH